MENKNVAMETDSLKEHDFMVWGVKVVDDDNALAIFTLQSGGLVVRDCRCFYTPWGDFQFKLPPSVDLAEELPEYALYEYPYPRIKELLLAEIERVKAKRFDDDLFEF
jgi:hypothetical protein